ncbi:hypothetical protein WJX74_004202 [Apatococcus lobatus]|uniref:RNA helicase n=1 Tax=Apatococcus lobatus TaxID=904363 RepID=A0AAW1QJK4_9CHLO
MARASKVIEVVLVPQVPLLLDVRRTLVMQCDMSLLTCRFSQSRAWFTRLPASRSLLLGLDAFPLPAADPWSGFQAPQRVQQAPSSSAAAFSKALLSRDALRPRVRAQATSLELDEIEILAGPQITAAESEDRGAFDQLGCDDRVTGNLGALGIEQPTPVQEAGIPSILEGRNVALKSYTGSGKTLAYLLPTLTLATQRAEEEFMKLKRARKAHEAGTLQGIVVAPSRELAMQIVRVAQSLLPEEARATVQQAIGGANPARQSEALKKAKPMVVVGTPGRLAELSRAGQLQMHHTGILVLDEVDELMQTQFREPMQRLVDHCGKRREGGRQTVLVSATLSDKVLAKARTWCPHPHRVFIGGASSSSSEASGVQEDAARPEALWGWSGAFAPWQAAHTPRQSLQQAESQGLRDEGIPAMPPSVQHAFYRAPKRHHVDAVRRCIHALDAKQALVFMNFQQRLRDTEAKLRTRGLSVGSLHGELDKSQRQAVLAAFRRGQFRVLVVSDVAARGLDVPECDVVFNLELPSSPGHYAHRAGRTGRFDRPGWVVSIADERDLFVLDKFSRKLVIRIPEAKAESGQWSVVKPSAQQQQQQHEQPSQAQQDSADQVPQTETSPTASSAKQATA